MPQQYTADDYTYEIESTGKDGDKAYSATVYEFPHIRASGPTEDDALRNIKNVVAIILNSLYGTGKAYAIPAPAHDFVIQRHVGPQGELRHLTLARATFTKEMHCCGTQDEKALFSVKRHDGGGGAYLVLNATEWAFSTQEELSAFTDKLNDLWMEMIVESSPKV